MFGVDTEGHDKLSKIKRPLRLGSTMDIDVIKRGYDEFLSNNPEVQAKALEEALLVLHNRSDITLEDRYLAQAREEIIKLKSDSFKSKVESHERDRELFTARNASMIQGLHEQHSIQREIAKHTKDKHLQKLEEETDHDDEEVIRLALKMAYEEGDFMSAELRIKKEKELLIEQWAIQKSYEDTQERAILASRSAILSTALN